jgi:hypothetical protein
MKLTFENKKPGYVGFFYLVGKTSSDIIVMKSHTTAFFATGDE